VRAIGVPEARRRKAKLWVSSIEDHHQDTVIGQCKSNDIDLARH